jgi:hypothetical protein
MYVQKYQYSARLMESRDSSVGIALAYGLDDRGSRVRFSAGDGIFSLRHDVQTGSGEHSASNPMGAGGPSPGQSGKLDHSRPCSAEVKNALMTWNSGKHKDNSTFTTDTAGANNQKILAIKLIRNESNGSDVFS